MGRGQNTHTSSAGSRITAARAVREANLQSVLAEWGIEPGYDSTNPNRRFTAVAAAVIDGEANAAASFDSLDEAATWFSGGRDNSNPREPALVVDLDTGQRFQAETISVVQLEPQGEAGPADPSQRDARLDALFAEWGIDENYYDEDSDPRYAAVLAAVVDDEANAAASFSSLPEASEWLAGGYDNDNPREPALVLDLDTGQRFQPQTTHETRITSAA